LKRKKTAKIPAKISVGGILFPGMKKIRNDKAGSRRFLLPLRNKGNPAKNIE
jgi:hypothetical protein